MDHKQTITQEHGKRLPALLNSVLCQSLNLFSDLIAGIAPDGR